MSTVLHVHGMTCGHCVKSITTALTAVDGVTSVDVDLNAGTVTVGGSAATASLAAAIEDAGYDMAASA